MLTLQELNTPKPVTTQEKYDEVVKFYTALPDSELEAATDQKRVRDIYPWCRRLAASILADRKGEAEVRVSR